MDYLVEELNNLLLEKEVRVVTAESCTGGMLSSAITARAGSSKVFERGFVTYSNQSKEELLSVPENIIDNYGAVSSQCAEFMVLGALDNSNADIAVSITGIAGPAGDADNKPVGLVYISTGVRGREPVIAECNFSGNRQEIRKAACEKALTLLIKTVNAI